MKTTMFNRNTVHEIICNKLNESFEKLISKLTTLSMSYQHSKVRRHYQSALQNANFIFYLWYVRLQPSMREREILLRNKATNSMPCLLIVKCLGSLNAIFHSRQCRVILIIQ